MDKFRQKFLFSNMCVEILLIAIQFPIFPSSEYGGFKAKMS